MSQTIHVINRRGTCSILHASSKLVCVHVITWIKWIRLKKVWGTKIGTKFAPCYAILFMADLKEKILSAFEEKPMTWWRYIDIFFIWEHGEKSMEEFLNELNRFPPIIKLTAEYLKETINFLDVNIRLVVGSSWQICLLSLIIHTSF